VLHSNAINVAGNNKMYEGPMLQWN